MAKMGANSENRKCSSLEYRLNPVYFLFSVSPIPKGLYVYKTKTTLVSTPEGSHVF
jgi:hypothetical protein